jgi:beta-exotoxin I transport system permease protein
MNMILRELKSIRRSLIIWCAGMVFLVYVGMMKYAGFRDSGQAAMKLMNNMPVFLKKVMGLDKLNLTLASGYYVLFFLYFGLLCGIHAIMQGAVVISKEERDKTADFLLSKPVKRSQVITAKLIASLISILILNATTWISSVLIVGQFNSGKSINGLIKELMIALFLLQLLFLAMGLLIGVVAGSTKRATGISSGILLGTFIISVIVDMFEKIGFLKYITPFKYFDAKEIYLNGFNSLYIIITVVFVLISILLTYGIFEKRDIHV